MQRHVALLWAVLALTCYLNTFTTTTYAAQVKGTASSDSGFKFIGRFCFDYDPLNEPAGQFQLSVRDQSSNGSLSWVIYSDEEFSWPAVLDMKRNGATCDELTALHTDNNNAPAKRRKLIDESVNPDGWVTTQPTYIYQHLRPRFWFLALANCKYPEQLHDIEYDIHFLNSKQSSFEIEFGTNERGLNTLYLVFGLMYTVFIVVHAIGVYRLRKEIGFIHPIVKLFTLAVVFEYISIFCYAIHYLSFGSNGVGVPAFANIGEVMTAVSRVLFISTLLLLAHGWTISTDVLRSRRTIIGVVASFLILQIALLGVEWASYDPELTFVTAIELGLQFTVVACYLSFGVYFVAVIFFVSYRKEQAKPKKQLYLRLGSLYSVWMLGPPIVAIFVMLLDDWVREKIVSSVTISVTALGYSVLSFLFWPSRAQEYFRIDVAPQGVELIDFASDPMKNSLLEDGSSEDAQQYRAL